MTNGDAGHQTMGREELAARRRREAEAAAAVVGADSTVLDNHDGGLQPTLAVREDVIRIIRSEEADLVITHRPNDYHPDHRYTSQVVQDAAYMVTVPHVAEDTPSLRKNPLFMYFNDHFRKPIEFQADVAVDVDDVMATKWAMLDKMESQFYEWMPWHDGELDTVPVDGAGRLTWLEETWGPRFRDATSRGRGALAKWYGDEAASSIEYAESFEVSEYGYQPSDEELLGFFPFLARSV